ncbi:uncharacterized protein LOC123876110 [Maniola jurtina]|uniref:uncharacterized protein LOC123876110 n=1 Tax=Maniola jurtina TaxID=191418 RepID=UPI001E688A41|nr:uncharacterized protein LOC123876110 [Maniola jurtina]
MERDPTVRVQFVKDNNLCLNCIGFHSLENCKSRIRCFCGASHHSKLHAGIEPATQALIQNDTVRASSQKSVVDAATYNKSVAPAPRAEQAQSFIVQPAFKTIMKPNALYSNRKTILLPTAVVYVFNNQGERFTMRILLDSGSMCHIITKSFCDRLNLKINASTSVIQGVGLSELQVQGQTRITLHSRIDNRCRYSIQARVVDKLSDNIPNEFIDLENLHHLKNLPLADDEFHTPAEIDCLIGNELFPFILGSHKVMSPDSSVVGMQSAFGYVLMGKADCLASITTTPLKENSFHAFSKTTEPNLEELTQRFWELDSVPNKEHLSPDDTACERIFTDSLSRDIHGRYIVSLPFKDDPAVLGRSYEIAKRRLSNLEKRLNSIPELRKDYNDTISEYLNKGYLNLIKNPQPGPCYYIPHHAVYRPDKTSSRTRIVLDASCKTVSDDKLNRSLNDILYTGPNLQANIFDLLINLRLFSIALSADIEKMYFQIKLAPDDHRYQRILYRFDTSDRIETYEFNCVSFGVCCSPYLAMRVVKQLAKDERARFPNAALAAERHFYMDDYVSSVHSIEEAKDLYDELVQLFNAGGFKLTKWISNSTHLLKEIPTDLHSPSIVQFDENSITANTKIVGLQWEPNADVFTFKVNAPNKPKCTKRIILSATARLFDPLSLLGPVTALLKLLVQECWKQNLDWDEDAPSSIQDQWFQLQRELPLLEQLQIPRHIGILKTTNNISLIGFADASEKCYGAVVYLRVSSEDADKAQVTLLCARSRVASPKCNVSLPRLELCANLLLSNLIVAVKDSISERVKINQIFAFSDSTIALSWIHASPHRFQTFVANRIAAINANLPAENWYHVSGKENPADIISRPIMPAQLLNNTLWFHGPSWVSQPFCDWPLNAFTEDELPEQKRPVSLITKPCNIENDYNCLYNSADRMSNWNRFLHAWVYVLRFSKLLKSNGDITVTDLEVTETYILRVIQKRHSFNTGSNALRKLNAFPDTNDLIRVGGRLSQSELGYSQKHPVVLPAKDRIVHLIVDHFHKQNAHAGPALLLALLRQKYWIVAARNMVRKIVQSCNRCFKLKPKNTFPIMGDLPHYRVSEVKSFVFTGVDYAGPFYITPYRRRGVKSMKAYLCLFICLTTKALHLELVQSYWQRWSREYLSSLQSRQKWNTPSLPIQVGCIVIIRDDNSPPLSWPLGIIQEVYPGKDGVVRTARVRTRTGSYVRPVVRLCPLPLQ